MAIALAKKSVVSSKILKLVSVLDDAIDWKRSLTHVEPETENGAEPTSAAWEACIEARKAAFSESHEIAHLAFVEGAEPTVFHFKHPSRLDAADALRDLGGNLANDRIGLSGLMNGIWHRLFLGTSNSLLTDAVPATRLKNGELPAEFMEALHQADVRDELSHAVARFMTDKAESRQKK